MELRKTQSARQIKELKAQVKGMSARVATEAIFAYCVKKGIAFDPQGQAEAHTLKISNYDYFGARTFRYHVYDNGKYYICYDWYEKKVVIWGKDSAELLPLEYIHLPAQTKYGNPSDFEKIQWYTLETVSDDGPLFELQAERTKKMQAKADGLDLFYEANSKAKLALTKDCKLVLVLRCVIRDESDEASDIVKFLCCDEDFNNYELKNPEDIKMLNLQQRIAYKYILRFVKEHHPGIDTDNVSKPFLMVKDDEFIWACMFKDEQRKTVMDDDALAIDTCYFVCPMAGKQVRRASLGELSNITSYNFQMRNNLRFPLSFKGQDFVALNWQGFDFVKKDDDDDDDEYDYEVKTSVVAHVWD